MFCIGKLGGWMLPREVVVNDSDNISGLGYDPEDLKLVVSFKDGSLYEYRRVPHSAFGELVSANSVGKHFHALIRQTYKGVKVA
jgi:hypothetical protein